MPLNLRGTEKVKQFNVPVSYKVSDTSGKFLDARNVNTIQDRLDTRFGTRRFNANSLGGPVQSLSSFVKADGSRFIIAKVGTKLISVSEAGTHTDIKTGLSEDTVHRGITGNDRHIISIEEDGLFSWDGTIFSKLGANVPSAPTIAEAAGGNLVATNKYQVAITFYASSIGFESNAGFSNEFTLTSTNKTLNVSNIPTVSDNALVDKVRIYLKNVTANGEFYFVEGGEIPLGQTTFGPIQNESTSSSVAPENHFPPNFNTNPAETGGGKFLAWFNSKLIYAGNSQFRNEVYFSLEDLPDAFDATDNGLVLTVPGQGAITGLAVGLFDDSVLDPYLVIFKRKSTWLYSEIGGQPRFVCINAEIGCVSHDTIQVKNGSIYFLSEEGWRPIVNGKIVTDKSGDAITLGNGDIDDIFKSNGFVYEVNRNLLPRSFSVYYPTLDQYLTWVSEGVSNEFAKTYVYQFEIGGFVPYEFSIPATCAVLGEDGSGRDQVLFGTSDGYIIRHSIKEAKSDINEANTEVAINAFAVLPWVPQDGDMDATYSFRELIVRALSSAHDLTFKTYLNYLLADEVEDVLQFSNPNSGFILDESELDEGILGDGRETVVKRADINRTGESIAIGFYQSTIGANIGLVSMQVDSNKNGNRNIPSDTESDEAVFDDETGTYFNSPSESARIAQEAAAAAQAAAAEAGGYVDIAYSGYSDRFDEFFESDGLTDTLDKILKIMYTPPSVILSASGSGTIREKGDAVTASTLVASVTKKSDAIARIKFYLDNVAISGADYNPPSNTGSGNTNHNWTGSFSDNATFKVEVTDDGATGGPNTVNATTSFTFVHPYYHGCGAPARTAAQVAAMTKSIITSNADLNRSFTSSNGDVYYFAYPTSYGALTSILDENGFETISDWTLRTENITGLDGNPVSYRIYEFNNPVIAGSTNFTFKR